MAYNFSPNIQSMMNQVNQLMKSVSDPQKAVSQMLQSGRVNQQQLEQAKQMAEQFRSMMK